jgi:adenylate kinase
MLPKVIYIMGPPGAGKGTQATLLAQTIGYHQFSTGAAFRETAAQDTEFGRKVKDIIDNGFLCPPELAAEIVINAIKKYTSQGDGLIFDGTPRTVAEAKIIDQFFLDKGYGKPLVIYLDVDRQDMISRNSKRRYCLGVSPDFPVVTSEDEERCRQLGGTVGRRPDDDPDKLNTRWDQFKELTWPVVEEYRHQGIAHIVDGHPAIPEVHHRVMDIIKACDQGQE